MRVTLLWDLLGLLASVGCQVAPSRTASAQIEARASDPSHTNRFSLSELKHVPPWASLQLSAPYTSTVTINQRLGFQWADADRFGLAKRDDIYLAVFVSGSKVVRVEEWKRSRFDCSPALSQQSLSPISV